jgi:hypothetical protein
MNLESPVFFLESRAFFRLAKEWGKRAFFLLIRFASPARMKRG